MRTVTQRVARASVTVDDVTVGAIDAGLMILLGVERGDTERDASVLAAKIAGLRIFPGDSKPMNRSVGDIGGAALVVSQFTLAASVRRGRRPGFDRAEDPARAEALYAFFCEQMRSAGVSVQTGTFGAHMDVALTNDGPVTILIDCRDGSIIE